MTPKDFSNIGIVGLIVAALFGFLQAVIILYLSSIKSDLKDIWEKINNHGHKLECDKNECKPKTAGVLTHD